MPRHLRAGGARDSGAACGHPDERCLSAARGRHLCRRATAATRMFARAPRWIRRLMGTPQPACCASGREGESFRPAGWDQKDWLVSGHRGSLRSSAARPRRQASRFSHCRGRGAGRNPAPANHDDHARAHAQPAGSRISRNRAAISPENCFGLACSSSHEILSERKARRRGAKMRTSRMRVRRAELCGRRAMRGQEVTKQAR
jgi:hypothetical protein